jgi:hypothetical protein
LHIRTIGFLASDVRIRLGYLQAGSADIYDGNDLVRVACRSRSRYCRLADRDVTSRVGSGRDEGRPINGATCRDLGSARGVPEEFADGVGLVVDGAVQLVGDRDVG